MPRMTLDEVLADDSGLLDVTARGPSPSTEEERIVSSFEEINRFVDRYGHLPGRSEKPSVVERSLQIKLAGLVNDVCSIELLRPFDRHSVLPASETISIAKTLNDILGDDELLATPQDDIFKLVHARPAAARPDLVSERQECMEFGRFKPLFEECVADLAQGKRRAVSFSREQEISAGEFFVLGGVMVYVAEVGETHIRNGKRNARLRLIFDNGTEGNNLLRSLATQLYKDPQGRRVTAKDIGPLFDEVPQAGDRQTGMIYVVKSLSKDPTVRKLDGLLHKIGFTSGKMEVRIQNAKDDPTFLMASVHPVATYTLYNVDRVKLEHLLHSFFSSARLDIDISDRFGKSIRPREWFLVPKEAISDAVDRLRDGSITEYEYDREAGRLRRRT